MNSMDFVYVVTRDIDWESSTIIDIFLHERVAIEMCKVLNKGTAPDESYNYVKFPVRTKYE